MSLMKQFQKRLQEWRKHGPAWVKIRMTEAHYQELGGDAWAKSSGFTATRPIDMHGAVVVEIKDARAPTEVTLTGDPA